MDLISVISLITGLLGVPPSLYFFVQIRRDLNKPAKDVEDAKDKYLHFVEL